MRIGFGSDQIGLNVRNVSEPDLPSRGTGLKMFAREISAEATTGA